MNKVFALIIGIVLMGQVPGIAQNNVKAEYHKDVVGVSKDGMTRGLEAMTTYLQGFKKNHGALADRKSAYRVSVNQQLDYEIGTLKTEKGGLFAALLIWIKQNGKEQILLQAQYEKSSDREVPQGITEARENWVKLCNAKDVSKLVGELYTDDAIYYNRGRILVGHEQLTQEYSYMASPSYSLQLTPKHVELVSDDLAFEIGRCSGSYPLPYMLIWKKQEDGSWKVYLDSNY